MSSDSNPVRRWDSAPPQPDEGGERRIRNNFGIFCKKNKLICPNSGRDNAAAPQNRKTCIPRANSAANRNAPVRDPRDEIHPPAASGKFHLGEAAREEIIGDDMRAAIMLKTQTNRAVNRKPLARDPRKEIVEERHSLCKVVEDEVAGAPPPVRLMDKARNPLAKTSPPGQEIACSPFADYETENHPRRLSANSSFDLEPHPEEEQESFRSRSTESYQGSQMSGSSQPARSYTIHKHESVKVIDSDEDEPETRPSEPARRRQYSRSLSFDVDQTRALVKSRLKDHASENEFVGDSSKEENLRSSLTGCLGDMGFDPDDIQMAIKSTGANSSEDTAKVVAWLGTASANGSVGGSREGDNFRSSLASCLGDMGFNSDDIKMAITSTGANSSEDAAQVVAWLGNHEGGCRKHREGKDDSARSCGEDQYYSCDETQHSKRTNVSTGTNGTTSTNSTTDTQESDEKIRELKDSLKRLGFSNDDVKKHKELFRRHSNTFNASEFISAMMDVDVGCSPPPADKPTAVSQTNEEGGKSIDSTDDLVRSISDMGFERDRVKIVISDMQNSGVTMSKIDADKVLGVLLGGDIPVSRSGGRAQSCSRLEIDRGNNGRLARSNRPSSNRNIRTAALSTPLDTNQRPKEVSVSIEITPGEYARLLKGRQTWDAMHDGTAISAVCIICGVTLQCCPEADYVLCPDCDVVSPLTTNGVISKCSRRGGLCGHVGAVGLGYKRK